MVANVWHGNHMGCGVFNPTTRTVRRQQPEGLGLVMLLQGYGRLTLNGEAAVNMHPGTVTLLPAGHRFWREVDQAEIGFINLPPGSEAMIASVLSLRPGPSSWLSKLEPSLCRQRLLALVADGTSRNELSSESNEKDQLPALIRLTIDMLNEASPNEASDHYSVQQLRQVACDPRPLEQVIPDYHRWRLQVREKLGTSPGKLRQQLRLERAQRMLHDHELTIQVIAQACGYHNASQFIRIFRQHIGCSPNRWRNQRASGLEP